jgi:hypothetical protein
MLVVSGMYGHRIEFKDMLSLDPHFLVDLCYGANSASRLVQQSSIGRSEYGYVKMMRYG